MNKPSPLSYHIERQDNGVAVTLAGDCGADAEAVLRELASRLPPKAAQIVLDLAGVATINSLGIAAFAGLIKEITRGHAVELHACPSALIDYANISAAFLGEAEVVSCLFPLLCDGCNRGAEQLVVVASQGPGATVPGGTCAHCGGRLAPAIEPEHYFGFLDQTDE